MKNRILTWSVLMSLLVLGSCAEDFLDTEPERTISTEQLATSSKATSALLRGMYVGLRNGTGDGGATDYGHVAVGNFTDFMSNDATNFGPGFNWWVATMRLEGREQQRRESFIPWILYYKTIFTANQLIDGIDPDVADPEFRAFLGQAYAMRAFCYFNLVRTYATAYSVDPTAPGIPLYEAGSALEGNPRVPVQEVYDQLVSDIEQGLTLLEGYSGDIEEIDEQVAKGIAARIYLEIGNYTTAATMANEARQGFDLMTGTEWVENGFYSVAGSSEFMWGTRIDGETTTFYSSWMSHWGNLDPGYAGLVGSYKLIDARLYNSMSDTDMRKQAFVGSEPQVIVSAQNVPAEMPPYANLKFEDKGGDVFEADYIYMRSAEMYLIEAEALLKSGDAAGAQAVLTELVSTRQPDYTGTTNGNSLEDEIYFQRRVELWGEGQAFYDLKRLQKPIERDYDGSNHFFIVNKPANDNVFVFQIPEEEIQANGQISATDQNPL